MEEDRLLLWSFTGLIFIDVEIEFDSFLLRKPGFSIISSSFAGNGIDSVILLSSESKELLVSFECKDLLSPVESGDKVADMSDLGKFLVQNQILNKNISSFWVLRVFIVILLTCNVRFYTF